MAVGLGGFTASMCVSPPNFPEFSVNANGRQALTLVDSSLLHADFWEIQISHAVGLPQFPPILLLCLTPQNVRICSCKSVATWKAVICAVAVYLLQKLTFFFNQELDTAAACAFYMRPSMNVM